MSLGIPATPLPSLKTPSKPSSSLYWDNGEENGNNYIMIGDMLKTIVCREKEEEGLHGLKKAFSPVTHSTTQIPPKPLRAPPRFGEEESTGPGALQSQELGSGAQPQAGIHWKT